MATLLLVVTLLTLSGLTATAETLFNAATANSCCDHDCDPDQPPAGPCSTPDCPCFSCITMIVSPPLSLQYNSVELPHTLVTPQRYQSSAYLRSIEYPPEQA